MGEDKDRIDESLSPTEDLGSTPPSPGGLPLPDLRYLWGTTL